MLESLQSMWRRIHSSKLGARLLHGAGWNLLATVAYRGSLLLAMIIVARILEKEQFGALGIILSSIIMFETVAAAGMRVTAAKHVAEYCKSQKERAARVITLTILSTGGVGVLIALALFLAAPWFAGNVLSAPMLVYEIRIAALVLIFNALVSAQTGILAGLEAFRCMAFVNAAGGAVTLPAIVAGAYWGGVSGALWGVAGGAAFLAVVNGFAIFRLMRAHEIPITLQLTTEEAAIAWQFSLPALAAGVMIAPVNWAGAALLVNQPNGFSEMGVFTASNQWFSILLFLPGILSNAFLPVFSDHAAKGMDGDFRRLVTVSLKSIILSVLPIAFAVIILSPYIMGLYGPEYVEGWPVLALIVLAAMVAAAQNMLGYVFAALNKMWLHLSTNALWAVVYMIVVAVALYFKAGALALALSMLVAYSVKMFVLWRLILRHLRNDGLRT